MTRRLPIALVAAVLVLAGCASSSGPAAPSSSHKTTTTAAKADLTPFTGWGPYGVGTIDLALADGRRVVAWYPVAKADATGPLENFDIASLLRPDLQAKIPAAERPPFTIDDHVGAKPDTAAGPFPIVLFSHGYAGFPEQSATLTTHIASWGFVVVAPDHVERSLSGILGDAAVGVPHRTDTQVLESTLALVIADNQLASSKLYHMVIPDKVAVIGHSSGATAAYELAAADPAIKSFISYAVEEPANAAVPKVPGMVMYGTADGVIPPAHDRSVFAGMQAPKYLVSIAGAGHLVFSDICLIGRTGGGIIAIGEKLGLPIQMFAKLGTDGCQPPDIDPTRAFPAIDDLSVDFLRWTLGIEPKPVGLDDPTIGAQFKSATIGVTAVDR